MSGVNRRLTVAQIFEDEEDEAEESQSISPYDKVVELINEASLMPKDSQKINNLKQVQELVLHKDPTLLDNFLDEILAFQSDRCVDVRKFVINFMEEACKKDKELLTKILPCLQLLLEDENINVQKKVMLILSQVYRCTLQWLSKAKTKTDDKTYYWEMMKGMKNKVVEWADSENDGVRTHAIKFMEGMVLTLSKKTKESELPKNIKPENDVSLDFLTEDTAYLKIKRLEEEGRNLFDIMLKFQASPHISSINLMTVMGSITNIAKQRPEFFGRVVQSFEMLQVNLPPTLAKSQVSSVRKNLKMHMLSLLKHPMSQDYITQITTLLTDLGASNSEVMKAMPKIDESKKRKAEDVTKTAKKAKIEIEVDLEDDDIGMTPFVDRYKSGSTLLPVKQRQSAIDITSEDLEPRLNVQNVADLVLISMVMLPDSMPAHFQSTYTPIAAAGTEGQIKHMARLLATQLTTAGMGKGIAEIQNQMAEAMETAGGESPDYQSASPKQLIQTVVGGHTKDSMPPPPPKVPTTSTQQQVRRGIKQFKLSQVTQELEKRELDEMTLQAFKRILNSERSALQANVLPARCKLLSSCAGMFGGDLRTAFEEYIFEDLRSRFDLAFAWLYQEYATCMGFSSSVLKSEKPTMATYDECLTRLLSGLLARVDLKEGFFQRLLVEAPAVTDNAVQILKKFCLDESRVSAGMNTLKELILTRPAHRQRFLDVIVESCSHEKLEVRNTAIKTTKALYENPQIAVYIELCASNMLKYLLNNTPPPEMFPKLKPGEMPKSWSEDLIKMCLYLYLGLLPINHKLIHELAVVYTAASADIKRTILRVLENPVKGMGMQSPELLTLVETCPKGAETLVTRIIHILTDKAAPSPELVERVRDLFQKRVPDVRFLIPVLTGLHKKEVIGALPKLIKLNPIVVKEVFNRLLGGHGDASYSSPLTPAELLIALHNIDPNKCDMKTIIKASNLCFSEKMIYTQEVLAKVLQSLMEQTPLPTLFMRTVLQALSMYPKLMGLVLNILHRLITKQVWKQKRVWEGFIKTCQRTKPQSFQVLLQLPTAQLRNVFESSPDLREPMLEHVKSFTEHQIAHIPKAIINVLERDPLEDKRVAEQKEKEKLARLQEEKGQMENKNIVSLPMDTSNVVISIPSSSEDMKENKGVTNENIQKKTGDLNGTGENIKKVGEQQITDKIEELKESSKNAANQENISTANMNKTTGTKDASPMDANADDSPDNSLAIAEDQESEQMDVSVTTESNTVKETSKSKEEEEEPIQISTIQTTTSRRSTRPRR